MYLYKLWPKGVFILLRAKYQALLYIELFGVYTSRSKVTVILVISRYSVFCAPSDLILPAKDASETR